jgi:hypothetical protein
MKNTAYSRPLMYLCSRKSEEALRRKAMYDKLDKDTLMAEKVDRAIRKAAEKILEKAKQTHICIVIWENDQIKEVPPKEMDRRLNATLSLESRV